jgi:hypothetical protein
MNTAVLKNEYKKLEPLKEPLISGPTQEGLKTGFLRSIFGSGRSQANEEQSNEGDEDRRIRQNEEQFEKILHKSRAKPSFYRPAPNADAV